LGLTDRLVVLEVLGREQRAHRKGAMTTAFHEEAGLFDVPGLVERATQLGERDLYLRVPADPAAAGTEALADVIGRPPRHLDELILGAHRTHSRHGRLH